MAKAPPEAPATYFRLSDETWALIVEEYANGSTAKQLGAKWKVAPNSIYRHVGAAKMTKRDCGDQRSRANAKATVLAEKARDAKRGARRDTVDPALNTLFFSIQSDEDNAGCPVELARLATLASGRAMKKRLWAEAKALTGLAESYSRLAEKPTRDGGSIETVGLELLFEIVTDTKNRVDRRFAVDRTEKDDPDISIKMAYWEYQGEWYARMRHRETENLWRAAAAEKKLSELGVMRPQLTESMVEAARDSANWVTMTDDDIRKYIAMRANDGIISPDAPVNRKPVL